jgi:hypothetical protein
VHKIISQGAEELLASRGNISPGSEEVVRNYKDILNRMDMYLYT